MNFRNPYWDKQVEIDLLQQWILVHSLIYYELDTNVVLDETYDNNCKELYELQNEFTKEFIQSKYYDAFKDFNPSTGYDLINKLNKTQYKKIENIAKHVISLSKGWLS